MNLMFICDEYPPGRHGGIGSSVQTLARELVLQGHQVIVAGLYDWGYGGEDMFDDQGVKVYRFRRGLSSGLLADRYGFGVKAAYRILKASGIFHLDIVRSLKKFHRFLEDLIATHRIDLVEMPDFNDITQYSTRRPIYFPKLSVPVLVKIHGSVTHILHENGKQASRNVFLSEQHLFAQADAICSVSHFAANRARDLFSFDRPVRVLYNGITMNSESRSEPAKNRMQVIFSGSLSVSKGVYQLVKAWNIVSREIPGARLSLFGKGPADKISTYISPEAEGSVCFEGHVARETLMQALSASCVAVFPSYSECFSLAPLEAMSMGTSVIYTTRASGPELITDGVNGLLVDPDDTNAIASAIIRLIGDAEACARLASAGKELVALKFNITRIAADHIAYYHEILNSSH